MGTARSDAGAWFRAACFTATVLATIALSLYGGHGKPREWSIYLLLLPVLGCVLALNAFRERAALRPSIGVLILMICLFGVQLAQTFAHALPDTFGWLVQIIKGEVSTSYYTDALAALNDPRWIADFHLNDTLHMHSSTHPIGPVAYYVALIRWFGADQAALLGSLILAFLTACTVPAMYFFAGIWTESRETRLLACIFWTLCPAVGLVYPEFDQTYPILSMLLMTSCILALTRNRAYAVLFGLLLALATFAAYNLLVLGVFFVVVVIGFLWLKRLSRHAFQQWIAVALISLFCFLAVHFVFSAATGYQPLAAFFHASHTQKLVYERHTPLHQAMSNFGYFVLGSGGLPEILSIAFLIKVCASHERRNWTFVLSCASALTLIVLEFSGLLMEAARVWLFLQPLVFVPAALELAKWDKKPRIWLLAAQWLLLATIGRVMVFVYPM